MWPTRRRSRTRPFLSSSRPPAATCSRRRRQRAWAIMSRCRWSAIDRPPGSDYFRAKLAQENLIKKAGIPYTIVRSTQFFEFTGAIAAAGAIGQTVRLSTAYFQPIAADDVADVMADVALAAPLNGTIEIAGPERVRLSDVVGSIPERNRGCTRGDRRRSGTLFRRGVGRSVPYPWRQSAPWQDALRRLAQSFQRMTGR